MSRWADDMDYVKSKYVVALIKFNVMVIPRSRDVDNWLRGEEDE